MCETLCWFCKKSLSKECCWAREFEPVDGWTAKSTQLRMNNNTIIDSFIVEKCPEFVKDNMYQQVSCMELCKKLDIKKARIVNKYGDNLLLALAKEKGVKLKITRYKDRRYLYVEADYEIGLR